MLKVGDRVVVVEPDSIMTSFYPIGTEVIVEKFDPEDRSVRVRNDDNPALADRQWIRLDCVKKVDDALNKNGGKKMKENKYNMTVCEPESSVEIELSDSTEELLTLFDIKEITIYNNTITFYNDWNGNGEVLNLKAEWCDYKEVFFKGRSEIVIDTEHFIITAEGTISS